MKTYTWKFDLDPAPASRCRVSRNGGRYYGKVYTRFRAAAEAMIPKQCGVDTPLEGPIIVQLQLNCRSPKNPTSPYPIGDIDNYTKAILDSCNKIIWVDDQQIVGLASVEKRYADKPSIVLRVYHFNSYKEAEDTLEKLNDHTARYLQRLAI